MYYYKLTLAYDGTAYHGFQRQKNAPSIQAVLEKALSCLFREDIQLQAAGRTDAGVHALGQVISFASTKYIAAEKVPLALKSFVPNNIVVWQGELVEEGFHARYGTKGKTYVYKLRLAPYPDPCQRNYTWQLKDRLDIKAMQSAANYILGTHDFTSFRNQGTAIKSSIRTIEIAHWEQQDELLLFTVTGDGFLYRMVRNLVGAMVKVGRGKITPEEFKALLENKNRAQVGMSAPAQGLYLKEVFY